MESNKRGDEALPVAGVRLASVDAGISRHDREDLVLMEFAEGSRAAALFTRNSFAAAPVLICRRFLAQASPRYLIINSGNANAATGNAGVEDALACCRAVAQRTGVDESEVLPFSTGVIGERLPVENILRSVPALIDGLTGDGWRAAARAIMTTDTRPKICSRRAAIGDGQVTLTGIAKGAGMIRPDMATLLVYLATDAVVESPHLQSLLKHAVARSFNRISIDTDTSTNDSCVLIATGASGVRITDGKPAAATFSAMVEDACRTLAREIVLDAEGASKFIEVIVENGRNEAECARVAYAVAESPLVKTAMFASDANWGRIVMAVGKADVVDLDPSLVSIYLGPVRIVHRGARDAGYREELGAAVMSHEEITVRIDLGRGEAAQTVWASDLSHDYVSINADYRT